MDIKKMSDIEIKAMIYDNLSQSDLSQNNVKVLQNELRIRQENIQEAPIEKKK